MGSIRFISLPHSYQSSHEQKAILRTSQIIMAKRDQPFLRFLLVVFYIALLSIVHLCMHLKSTAWLRLQYLILCS
ncbi:hypothetical protein BCV72DRAFT_230131 [Rhizopus microsporus var. microsporus]|uniref:Uncharacterized protein n=2 Tax=Rhizopus microsporus TaxID=58291 RepID=A0A2G4SRD8_RHIZD|nr:uncharacterized protein RHIMIDRAFT_258432 [Rhizopus microsporus ATCC 52813]ORE05288.1 hypothetical protein BCV72DRAFT_230131 [Rhizopus microsporus var. microsporus]PHZ10956.1 hypothetical protein RHIMIDRAFT_258432 [Rhizopus microsporus ATCC 52813]